MFFALSVGKEERDFAPPSSRTGRRFAHTHAHTLIKTAASQVVRNDYIGDSVEHKLDVAGVRGTSHMAIDLRREAETVSRLAAHRNSRIAREAARPLRKGRLDRPAYLFGG